MAEFISSLLDFIRPGSRRVSPTKTIGAPGTPIYGGYVQEFEQNRKLAGREKYRTYSNILANTSIVAAGTRYYLNLVAKTGWKVVPVDDTPQAKEFAERIEAMMDDMTTPWHRVVRRAGMYRFYGFSVQEWTAKRLEDGTLGFLDIEPRPQITIERWDVDRSGTVQGIVQRSPQTQEEIYLPRSKLFYIVDDTLNDSPEGLGLFRHVVNAANTLQRYEQLEGFGFETDLRGVPVGRGPFAKLQELVNEGKLTVEQKNVIEKPLTDFIKNHIKNPALGMLLDSAPYFAEDDAATPSQTQQWALELLTGSNTTQAEVATAIERLNQEIARVLGVEGLLLGSTNHGSQALSTDKSHNFALIVDGTLTELKESFNKDFIDTIFNLNGWPQELKPKFQTDAVQYRNIEQVTAALRDLANAGAPLSIDDPAINEVRDLLGLSPQEALSITTNDNGSLMGSGTANDQALPDTEDTGVENGT